MEDIKVILENNTFQFNDEYYIQTKGTAMGSKFAPIYSTLVLAYLEAKLYELSELDFGTDFRSYLEEHFKRFLDDCFLIFTKSEEHLNRFHCLLNSLHPSIKYTIDKSNTRLPFLDTLVLNKNGNLYTDIYYKPTDSRQYLLYTSCHPNIPVAYHIVSQGD